MKKMIFAAVLLTAVLAVAMAQTAAQQKELEAIARRSVNGLSAKDRARAIEIYTDIMVQQGVPRDQAKALVEGNIENMFNEYEESPESAEARRMVEESEKRSREAEEQGRRERAEYQKRQEAERKQAEQARLFPGNTKGWPAASWFRSKEAESGFPKLASLKQPAGTNASYDKDGMTVYLTGGNSGAVLQNLVKQIESALGKKMTTLYKEAQGESYSVYMTEGARFVWSIKVRSEGGTVYLSADWG